MRLLVSVLLYLLARPATPAEDLEARVSQARQLVGDALGIGLPTITVSRAKARAERSVRAGLDVETAVHRAIVCARDARPPFGTPGVAA